MILAYLAYIKISKLINIIQSKRDVSNISSMLHVYSNLRNHISITIRARMHIYLKLSPKTYLLSVPTTINIPAGKPNTYRC